MDVIISFFLGGMVLFQIIMAIVIVVLIFSTISPNMRAHISHFLGNESSKDSTAKTNQHPEEPINVTQIKQKQSIKQPPITETTLRIEPVIVPPPPVDSRIDKVNVTPKKENIQDRVSKNVKIKETFEQDVIDIPDELILQVRKTKIKKLAAEISGLSQDDLDGIEYMEDNDPRKIQYDFAFIVANNRIAEPTKPVEFLCPSCHKKRLMLQKQGDIYCWICPSCNATYHNLNGIPAVSIPWTSVKSTKNTSQFRDFINRLDEGRENNELKARHLYLMAIHKYGISIEDVECMEYMEEDDFRINQYINALKRAYTELTNSNSTIPRKLLPPYPKFVLVSILDKNSVLYSKTLYAYFLGNNTNINLNDNVIVYARKSKTAKKPKRKFSIVKYISSPYEPPPLLTKSPISMKIEGKYLAKASKQSKKFHDPCCSQMDKISKTEVVWFQTEMEAMENGYSPCAKCILN